MGERFRELPSKIGIHVWQKTLKIMQHCRVREQLQLPSKIKVTRHYLLYMKKKLFAQAKGIKTHCNAFYVNKNRAVMPVISLSLSYVVSEMS